MDNKNALLAYMEKTHMGVKGLVTDVNGKDMNNKYSRGQKSFIFLVSRSLTQNITDFAQDCIR